MRQLALDVENHYHPFQQPKKAKPFQQSCSIKTRAIDNPSEELKRVQRKIVRNLLSPLDTPDFLMGAVKGKTILTNASAHSGARVVAKMDIKSYYPSVTNDHIYKVWRTELGCSREIANLLTRLTTYARHLPQGAPTSPILANMFLASIYQPILTMCSEKEVVATAYVDDLIFSGGDAREMMEPTRKLLGQHGLRFAAKKREVLASRSAHEITGIRNGKHGPRVPRKKLRELRAGFHKLQLGVIPEEERAEYTKRLEARVRYVNGVCAADAAKFFLQIEKYRAAANET